MIERQELYCHDCGNYVQFNVDTSLDGNHVFNCPVCKHEHCRVVKDGKITGIRWDSRNGQTISVSSNTITCTSTSTFTTYNMNNNYSDSSDSFAYMSWMSTTTAT